jgi:LuxR family maltose regulon positive regulatory protein
LRLVLERAGGFTLVLNILAHEVIIAHAKGDDEQALSLLKRALQLAEPEGFMRAFISKGSSMQQLLRKATAAGLSPDYARRLLEGFPQADEKVKVEPIPPERTKAEQETLLLIEPLTDRELEVLRLLNTSLDSNEIAAELYISVNTVRTHIKNIYSKLDVNRRMQAVERARELNLM